MTRRVQRHATPASQLFIVGQPAIWRWHGGIRHTKHLTLHLQVVPEELIFFMQMQRRAGFLLELPGSQEVIEVRVGVDDADHLQAQGVEAREDQFVITARVDDDGFFS